MWPTRDRIARLFASGKARSASDVAGAVGEVDRRRGTRVRFEAARRVRRKLPDVFAAYTRELEFARTRVVIKLFTSGTRFVSRSEARRVAVGLERFSDYRGVEEVGQGFVDELYRVWASAHPGVALTSVNANRAVAFMLGRGGRVGR